MAKFSVGRLEDGEGPSGRCPKRQRRDRQPQTNSEEQEETFSVQIYQAEEEEFSPGEEDEKQELVEEEINGEIDSLGCRSGSISVILTDPEVFDCPICCDPLSAPVFQCDNGHTACSSCCTKVMNKCPSCCLPIGYNRCRAIEKVLESIKVTCENTKFGCEETMTYSKKYDHLKICHHAPCSCPLSDCNFIGSSSQLYRHFSGRHEDSVVHFQYKRVFQITLNVSDRFLVLQEEMDGVLFILNNSNESLGNVISLSCIAPLSNRQFSYEILARPKGSTLTFQSSTKSIQNRVNNPPSMGFLLIPSDSFGSSGQLKLGLRIWRPDLFEKIPSKNYC